MSKVSLDACLLLLIWTRASISIFARYSIIITLNYGTGFCRLTFIFPVQAGLCFLQFRVKSSQLVFDQRELHVQSLLAHLVVPTHRHVQVGHELKEGVILGVQGLGTRRNPLLLSELHVLHFTEHCNQLSHRVVGGRGEEGSGKRVLILGLSRLHGRRLIRLLYDFFILLVNSFCYSVAKIFFSSCVSSAKERRVYVYLPSGQS